MNTSQLKRFAANARQQLRDTIRARVLQLGVTQDNAVQFVAGGILVGGNAFNVSRQDYDQLKNHYLEFCNLRGNPKDGLEGLVDEIAYTWFNRLTALRFLEANEYHRQTLTGNPDPAALREAFQRAANGDYPSIDPEKLEQESRAAELQDRPTDGTIFLWALIGECRSLKKSLALFDGAAYLELFLPDTLLIADSLVRQLTAIPDEDWKQIEIIGWLYQFYISEEKDRVMQSKDKYRPQDIPAATQLFTPNWIVQYMVQNSLGRTWLEGHPDSALRERMPYYLEGERNQTTPANALEPQDLTVLDPACGSGHILVYAYDLLTEMYLERGYNPEDIPEQILTFNLHGLDIDPRAAQLATFAVQMKARAHLSRRAFERLNLKPHVLAVQSTKNLKLPHTPHQPSSQADLFGKTAQPVALFNNSITENDWKPLLSAFANADSLGSLITPPKHNTDLLEAQVAALEQSQVLGSHDDAKALRILLDQAKFLLKKYKVVVANPPYAGGSRLNDILKTYAESHPIYKADLFALFIERCLEFASDNGKLAFMTPFVWMFISSYESMRKHLLQQHGITSLVQLEYNSGMEGALAPICTFTMQKNHVPGLRGEYVRLFDFRGSDIQGDKVIEAARNPSSKYRFRADARDFEKIPGSPIAYWASEKVLEAFEKFDKLADLSDLGKGLDTGSNDRFLRFWSEVSNVSSIWKNLIKGGNFQKWYGNLEYVINWIENGEILKKFEGSNLRNSHNYFISGITWTRVSSASTSFRAFDEGFIFESTGPCLFVNPDVSKMKILGQLNSVVTLEILKIIAPTLDFQSGQISIIPISESKSDNTSIEKTIESCITLSRADWDNFETSWDFATHPLLREQHSSLPVAYAAWEQHSEHAFQELKRLEIQNNEYWINAYGLQDELTPDVPDDQITIRRADLARDVRSLISYAVGCMMGRYSLDKPKLVFAGGTWDDTAYSRFKPDSDGILPILDTAYFEDDAVLRLREFVRVAFGTDSETQNLEFIASALKPNFTGTALEVIRAYMTNDFSKDHHRIYKKRPIYWRFTSGKNNAFNALVYLHRYTPDTIGRIRSKYVIPLLGKLQHELTALEHDTSKKAMTSTKKLRDQLLELRDYQDKLQHMADQRIELDLDDGVAFNYGRLEGLVYDGADLKVDELKKKGAWKLELLGKKQ